MYKTAAEEPRCQGDYCGVAGVDPDGGKEDDESHAQERDDW